MKRLNAKFIAVISFITVSFFLSENGFSQSQCDNWPYAFLVNYNIGIHTNQGQPLKPLEISGTSSSVCIDPSIKLSFMQPSYEGYLALNSTNNLFYSSLVGTGGDLILQAGRNSEPLFQGNLILTTRSPLAHIKFGVTPTLAGPDIEGMTIMPTSPTATTANVGINCTLPKNELQIGTRLNIHTFKNTQNLTRLNVLGDNIYFDASQNRKRIEDGWAEAIEFNQSFIDLLVSGNDYAGSSVNFYETNTNCLKGIRILNMPDNTASVGIGSAPPYLTDRLWLAGKSNTNNTFSLKIVNSDQTSYFVARDDRRIGIQSNSPKDILQVGDYVTFNGSMFGINSYYDPATTNKNINGNMISFLLSADAPSINPAGVNLFVDKIETSESSLYSNYWNDNYMKGIRILSNGNVGISKYTPNSRLSVHSSGVDQASSVLNLENGNNNTLFYVRDDGKIGINLGINGTNFRQPQATFYIKTQAVDQNDVFLIEDLSSYPTINNIFKIRNDGNIGVGTNVLTDKLNIKGNTNIGNYHYNAALPSGLNYRLSVDGQIIAREIIVNNTDDNNHWADFVFDDNYKLMKLEELEKQIKNEKHLPGVPTANDVKATGNNIGRTEVILLQKVEELTLYVIELKKEINQLKKDKEETK